MSDTLEGQRPAGSNTGAQTTKSTSDNPSGQQLQPGAGVGETPEISQQTAAQRAESKADPTGANLAGLQAMRKEAMPLLDELMEVVAGLQASVSGEPNMDQVRSLVEAVSQKAGFLRSKLGSTHG